MKKIKLVSLFSGFLILVFLVGCNNSSDDVLNVAVMPTVEGETIDARLEEKVNEEFRLMLEEKTGKEVNLYQSQEYAVGITALAEGNLDVLLVSPMSYYQASVQANVEPLVSYTSVGDETKYSSIFVTKSDNDEINTLSDLEGKTFGFVDQASSSGYLYPKHMLVQELDLDPATLENRGAFFDSVVYTGGHPNSLVALLNGNVDAIVIASQILAYLPAVIDGATIDDIKIIDETPAIPNPLFIVRTEIEEELKDAIREAYLSYENPEYFEVVFGNGNIRFATVDDSALENANLVVETLGVAAE